MIYIEYMVEYRIIWTKYVKLRKDWEILPTNMGIEWNI